MLQAIATETGLQLSSWEWAGVLPWLAQSEPRYYVAIAGIIVLIWVVFRIGSKRRARRASGEASPPKPAATPDPVDVHRAGEDLSEVLVQLQEVSREVEARLDTRIRYARRLIDQSEAVSERLEELLRNARELGMEPKAAQAPPSAGSAQAAAAYRSPANPRSVEVGEQQTAAPPCSDEADVALNESATPAAKPRPEVDRIRELDAAGHDAAEIARQVKLPVGEVELVFGLQRQANREKSS